MKNEHKLLVFLCILALSFMSISIFCLYDSSLSPYYVYQVGIYKEEENRDEKIKELKNENIEGYYYKNKESYVVLSLISEDKDEVKKHQTKIKGIVKTYHFKEGLSKEDVLKNIERSVNK